MTRYQGLAQQPLNAFLEADATHADDELNRVYGLLTAALAKKSATLAALKTSQRAWLTFRDAEVKATGTLFGEGSGRRQVEASFWSTHAGASAQDAALTRLTWERCRHLSG